MHAIYSTSCFTIWIKLLAHHFHTSHMHIQAASCCMHDAVITALMQFKMIYCIHGQKYRQQTSSVTFKQIRQSCYKHTFLVTKRHVDKLLQNGMGMHSYMYIIWMVTGNNVRNPSTCNGIIGQFNIWMRFYWSNNSKHLVLALCAVQVDIMLTFKAD